MKQREITMLKKIAFLFLSLWSTCFLFNDTAFASTPDEEITAIYFESIKNTNPTDLHDFLYAMPKGADLHNHISGATYAENLINYNLGKNFCINTTHHVAKKEKSCHPFYPLDIVPSSKKRTNATIEAWSLKNFNYAKGLGHDHFFAAFLKFDALVNASYPEILAEIINRAGEQNVTYLELMHAPFRNEAADLGTSIGWNSDLQVMYDNIMHTEKVNDIVEKIRQDTENNTNQLNQLLFCGTLKEKPGCDVTTKYVYHGLRAQSPEKVFAELIIGFEIAQVHKDYVGINLVQAEDDPIAIENYNLHMHMIAFLKQRYPSVRVSLHAGELAAPLVSPSELSFHITQAVKVAKADRIGHAVDIKHEILYEDLLKHMAENKIAVEINLSSNQYILGIDKTTHPFPIYLEHQVPITISTDDEGILRTNLTEQYVKAAQDFHLSYPTLKTISRNSLEYSFTSGNSLWTDNGAYEQIHSACVDVNPVDEPSTLCHDFLSQNEKAQLQWNLEKKFSEFEGRIATKQRIQDK